MSQIGINIDDRVVGFTHELVDLKNGYFQAKNSDGDVLTVNEDGVYKWEPANPDPIAVPLQRFSITGNIATFWPTGEKNVAFPIQVRP